MVERLESNQGTATSRPRISARVAAPAAVPRIPLPPAATPGRSILGHPRAPRRDRTDDLLVTKESLVPLS